MGPPRSPSSPPPPGSPLPSPSLNTTPSPATSPTPRTTPTPTNTVKKRKWKNAHTVNFEEEKALDETCLDFGVIQQVDGANTTPYERPGRIEEVEGEAEVEKDDGGWVLVGTQRKTRERGKVVQEEKKTEVERECKGGRDPIEALRKTWGDAVADKGRTGRGVGLESTRS